MARRVFHSTALLNRWARMQSHARSGPGVDRNRGDYHPAFGWGPGAKAARNQAAKAQGRGPTTGLGRAKGAGKNLGSFKGRSGQWKKGKGGRFVGSA